MIDYNKIKELVKDVIPEITEIRHKIHMYPEIACEEYKTAELVKEKLSSLNVDILPHFLETDVVAIMKGKGEGKNVALRADMDALPLQEKTELSYVSKIDGMMHACGHDGHTAMLIGAVKVLNQLRDTFDGSVRFVFQPGEEAVAAGKDLVEAGALLNPEPDAVFALHGGINKFNSLASKPGAMMAASDKFTIKLLGKGGHASVPEGAINPISLGTQIIESLQGLVSKEFSSQDQVVLTITAFQGGTNFNVIPDSVTIKGTVRVLTIENSKKMKNRIEDTIKCFCDLMNAKYEIEYLQPYIPLINDKGCVELGKKIATEVLGMEFIDLEKSNMGGEDFAYYLLDYPGAFFFLGQGEDRPTVHNPYFNFNDEVLYNGILFLVASTLESLEN